LPAVPDSTTTKGLLITFEGGEGSGKSTQAARLRDRLAAEGRKAILLREPGGTPLGEQLRQAILHRTSDMTPEAELLLFLAARAELVRSVILPALDDGAIVLCDRFSDSTLAYQGFGRGLDLETVRRLDAFATSGLFPDLTVLLDLPAEVGSKRKSAETDAFQREDGGFHQRVRQGYLTLAAASPSRWLVLDATLTPDEIEALIRKRVLPRLEAAR